MKISGMANAEIFPIGGCFSRCRYNLLYWTLWQMTTSRKCTEQLVYPGITVYLLQRAAFQNRCKQNAIEFTFSAQLDMFTKERQIFQHRAEFHICQLNFAKNEK